MFDSGVSAADLIDKLQNEVDIAPPVLNADFVHWLNALEYFLYTEIIKEERRVGFKSEYAQYAPEELKIADDEAPVRFEDIITIVPITSDGEGKKLTKVTLIGYGIFTNTFTKKTDGGKELICCNPDKRCSGFDVYYYAKPKEKTTDTNDNVREGNVRVPVEFIDLVKAKLRGEAYKVANVDNLAAKWLNDYNVLLESFKVWMAAKRPKLGV